METTGVSTEFRYLLVRLGRQLQSHDCEGLIYVHGIPDVPSTKKDLGLHVLSSLETMGTFDPLSPDKLQEILSKIGRKDLAQDIKDYKQSAAFKKATKLENNSKKRNKDSKVSSGLDERWVATKLIAGGADNTANQEERSWSDLFAMALTQTAQLMEQAGQLHRAMEAPSNSEQTKRRIEEALHSILAARDEVESLSKTLKRAVSAAGSKAGDERILDPAEAEGAVEATNKKKGGVPSKQRSFRERAHSFDGTSRTKAAVGRTSSLSIAATAVAPPPIPVELTPSGLTSSKLTPIPVPLPTIPTQVPSSPTVATTDHTSSALDDTPSTDSHYAVISTPTMPVKPAPASPKPTLPLMTPSHTPKPTPSNITTKHKASLVTSPKFATPSSTPNPAPNPTPISSNPAPSIPTAIPTKLKTGPATSPKPKRSTKTASNFQSKLDSLLAGATPTTPATDPTHAPISHSQTFPSFNALHSHTPTAKSMSPTPSPDFEPGHIYDDPNLRKERDESGGLYVNTQTVLSSAEYQNAKEGLKKRESEISIQVDSGLGAEDKSWGGELINIKGDPQYVNLQMLRDEYAELRGQPKTSTTGYTALNTKR